MLSANIEQAAHPSMLRNASRLDIARFTSLQGFGASAWLSVLPTSQDFVLTDKSFAAARLRLGLPVKDNLRAHCACGFFLPKMPPIFYRARILRAEA